MYKRLLLIVLLFSTTYCFSRNSIETVVFFNTQNSYESVYIHTDKDVYFAGDVILFKLYMYDKNNKSDGWQSKIAYITLFGKNGSIVSKSILSLTNNSYDGFIQIHDTLSTGIYKIFSWTNKMLINKQPVFSKEIIVINRFDSNPINKLSEFTNNINDSVISESHMKNSDQCDNSTTESEQAIDIEIVTNKLDYKTREEVSFLVINKNSTQNITSASISVAREEAIVKNTTNFIAAFSYDCKSLSDSISYINSSEKFLNAQITTSGHEYVDYNQYLQQLLPENFGLTLSGIIFDEKSNEPFPKTTVVLSTPDTIVNLKYFQTSDDGKFYFLLDDYYTGKPIYISFLNNYINKPTVQVNNKFLSEKFTPNRLVIDPLFPDYIDEIEIVKRTNKSFSTSQVKIFNETINLSKCESEVYIKPTSRIKTNDYVELTNFLEITNEIIPVLRIKKQNQDYVASMVNAQTRSIFNYQPQFFLDGVPISNIKSVLNIPFQSIRHIDIVNLPWAFGSISFSGIVAIFTKNVENKNVFVENGYKIVQGIPQKMNYELNFPSYSNENLFDLNAPDFRELLFWSPTICIPAESSVPVSFFTSDLKGNYIVTIEGISSEGIPFSTSTRITVK